MLNKGRSLLLLVSVFIWAINAAGQIDETKDFEQKTCKVFSSQGSAKNRGVIFSINYPSSYIASEIENENIVIGLTNPAFNIFYLIGVVKKDTQITVGMKTQILSEPNLKQSVISVTKNRVFMGYKKDFKIGGMSAAYLEYNTTLPSGTKNFIRQYYIIYKNYVMTISFTLLKLATESTEVAKKRFDGYKTFFGLAANSLTFAK